MKTSYEELSFTDDFLFCKKMNDGSTRVFLNASGEGDDISEGMKAFLSYLKTGTAGSELTRKIHLRWGRLLPQMRKH